MVSDGSEQLIRIGVDLAIIDVRAVERAARGDLKFVGTSLMNRLRQDTWQLDRKESVCL